MSEDRADYVFSGQPGDNAEILRLFEEAGAIITGSHFVYTSGRHSSVYVNKDALYVHTARVSELCRRMAQPYDAEAIDVVVGPMLGGIILAQWTAHHLNARRRVGETLAVYAEKEGDGPDKTFVFRRGYDKHLQGRRVLVVEDVLTTGGSVRRVVEAVRTYGGEVVGVSALCNRGGVSAEALGGVPLHALLTLDLATFTEEDCPFCRQGVPINTELGKGLAFLARQR